MKTTTNRSNMTFQEICNQRMNAVKTKAEAAIEAAKAQETDFIRELMEVTTRSEGTVKMWVKYNRLPNVTAMQAIAKHYGKPVEELFPQGTNV